MVYFYYLFIMLFIIFYFVYNLFMDGKILIYSIDTKKKLEIDYERQRAATEREMQAEFDAKLFSIKSNLEQQVI